MNSRTGGSKTSGWAKGTPMLSRSLLPCSIHRSSLPARTRLRTADSRCRISLSILLFCCSQLSWRRFLPTAIGCFTHCLSIPYGWQRRWQQKRKRQFHRSPAWDLQSKSASLKFHPNEPKCGWFHILAHNTQKCQKIHVLSFVLLCFICFKVWILHIFKEWSKSLGYVLAGLGPRLFHDFIIFFYIINHNHQNLG